MKLGSVYIPNKAVSERNENEYYPTPAIATLTLLKNCSVPHKIWEPAAGRGHIAKELTRNGHDVVATDLYPYDDLLFPVIPNLDMLSGSLPSEVDGVITNPPFKSNLPEKLIYRILEKDKVPFLALFVRLTFMESARRYEMFKKHPPSKILAFSERVNCHERYFSIKHGLGGMVAYAWFIWDYRNDKPTKTALDWVKPSDYISLLGE